MDETIGVKGGHNDRLRSLRITKQQKKKLQEQEELKELRELEKEVKRKQKYTLIKALPIVIAGGIVRTMYETAYGKPIDKEEENSKWRIKEYDADITSKTKEEFEYEQEQKRRKIVTLPSGQKVVVYITVREDVKEEPKTLDKDTINPEKPTIGKVSPVQVTSPVLAPPVFVFPKKEEVQEEKQIFSDSLLEEIESDILFKDIDFNSLDEASKEKLSKLRSRRIIDYYEDKLKEIRYELRQTIYDYNVLVYDENGIVLSEDAEIILDKLTEIISKIEELKRRINIEDLDKYDDNYIYVLIEEYLSEFKDQRLVKEIKDSPLYIEIAKKLEELEEKRDAYSKKVEEKQERLEAKEEDFDELKKKYYSIDKINDELHEFQKAQERILSDLKERVANSVSEYERVEYEMRAMTAGTRRMMRLLAFQMFLPGPRFAKSVAASTAAYLYFLRNIYNPNLVEKRYKVIKVEDYSKDIENSIAAIDDASKLLGKTSTQIDKMMKEISEKYKDYIGVIPECDQILSSLKKIKEEVEEKEFEMKRLKKEQELVLERNNAKVLTRGEYPVN